MRMAMLKKTRMAPREETHEMMKLLPDVPCLLYLPPFRPQDGGVDLQGRRMQRVAPYSQNLSNQMGIYQDTRTDWARFLQDRIGRRPWLHSRSKVRISHEDHVCFILRASIGKRYRTKKERLRFEKEGPPHLPDGSLDYSESQSICFAERAHV